MFDEYSVFKYYQFLLTDFKGITRIYTLTENLHSKTLVNAINNALVKFQDKIQDPLPKDIIEELYKLYEFQEDEKIIQYCRKHISYCDEKLFYFHTKSAVNLIKSIVIIICTFEHIIK